MAGSNGKGDEPAGRKITSAKHPESGGLEVPLHRRNALTRLGFPSEESISLLRTRKLQNVARRQMRYLVAFAETGLHSAARSAARITRQTDWEWRRHDILGFRRRYAEALEMSKQNIRDKIVSNMNKGSQRAAEFLLTYEALLRRSEQIQGTVEDAATIATEFHKAWELLAEFIPQEPPGGEADDVGETIDVTPEESREA